MCLLLKRSYETTFMPKLIQKKGLSLGCYHFYKFCHANFKTHDILSHVLPSWICILTFLSTCLLVRLCGSENQLHPTWHVFLWFGWLWISVHFRGICTTIFSCFITWKAQSVRLEKRGSLNESDPKVSDWRGRARRGNVNAEKETKWLTHTHTHYTHLQCLWTPATVSMMEHSPSFRQKARSLSSTHGLKTSERGPGSVGAADVERKRQI